MEIAINERRITEDLRKVKLQKENDLQQWKDLLNKMRLEHYYLSYIPNRSLYDIVNFFQQPSPTTLNLVLPIFKFINPEIQKETLANLNNMQLEA